MGLYGAVCGQIRIRQVYLLPPVSHRAWLCWQEFAAGSRGVNPLFCNVCVEESQMKIIGRWIQPCPLGPVRPGSTTARKGTIHYFIEIYNYKPRPGKYTTTVNEFKSPVSRSAKWTLHWRRSNISPWLVPLPTTVLLSAQLAISFHVRQNGENTNQWAEKFGESALAAAPPEKLSLRP